jgi:hypothetical protein
MIVSILRWEMLYIFFTGGACSDDKTGLEVGSTGAEEVVLLAAAATAAAAVEGDEGVGVVGVERLACFINPTQAVPLPEEKCLKLLDF